MAKKWHERSEADKRRVEKWIELRHERREEHLQKHRLKELNKVRGTTLRDEVAVIHYVEDTPRSLAIQFIRWQDRRNKRAKQ